jgi:hypothetical protein
MTRLAYAAAAVVLCACQPAVAQQEKSTSIQDAPCDWFSKTAQGWSVAGNLVRVSGGIAVRYLTIGRGAFQTEDGMDVYDYLEKKCGKK